MAVRMGKTEGSFFMFRKFLSLFVFLPLAVLLVAFTVANRHLIVVSFDPFGGDQPAIAFEMPLFLLVFGCLLVGVVAGGVATWLNQGTGRKEARSNRSAAKQARREADELRREAQRSHGALPAPDPRI